MKINLPSGRAFLVGVKYDEISVKRKKVDVKRHTTSIKVTKLNDAGQPEWTLDGATTCSETDQFSKQEGRKRALIDVFRKDCAHAEMTASKKAESHLSPLDIRDYYSLPRQDRSAIFKTICPKLCHPACARKRRMTREQLEAWKEERRKQRQEKEMALLKELQKKYPEKKVETLGPPTREFVCWYCDHPRENDDKSCGYCGKASNKEMDAAKVG